MHAKYVNNYAHTRLLEGEMMQRWVKILIVAAILADLLIYSAVMISYADLNKKYQGYLGILHREDRGNLLLLL